MTVDPVTLAWTDGSARPTNPGFGGWAYVIDDKPKETVHYAYSWMPYGTTNNLAELTAIEKCLREISVAGNITLPVHLHSDSEWAVQVILGGYRARKHVELIQEIRGLMDTLVNVKLLWVRGHSGNAYNELVDRMASLATRDRNRSCKCVGLERPNFLNTASEFLDGYESIRNTS